MKKGIDINKVMTDYERNVLGIGASPEEKAKADAMTPLEILNAREKETETYMAYLDERIEKLDGTDRIEKIGMNNIDRFLKIGLIVAGGTGITLSLLLFIWALLGYI